MTEQINVTQEPDDDDDIIMNTHPLADERISICNPSPSTSSGGNSCYRYCTVYVIFLNKYRHLQKLNTDIYKNVQVTVNLTLQILHSYYPEVHYFEIILNKYTLYYSVKTFNIKNELLSSDYCAGTLAGVIYHYEEHYIPTIWVCAIGLPTVDSKFHYFKPSLHAIFYAQRKWKNLGLALNMIRNVANYCIISVFAEMLAQY